MRGELVVIKDISGNPLVRRVWEADRRAVYVTDEKGFACLQAGEDLLPVGFRREDVFVYKPGIEKEISDGRLSWDKLTPLSSVTNEG